MIVINQRETLSATSQTPVRLNFRLREFVRLAWVSTKAREVWAPRLAAIVRACGDLEWRSVAIGARPVAMLSHVDGAKWSTAAVSAHLRIQECQSGGILVAASPETLRQASAAQTASDHETLGGLLGYPDCCARWFSSLCTSLGQSWLDPTWFIGHPSAHAALSSDITQRNVPATCPADTNVLLRYIGLRRILHMPCDFSCPASVQRAKLLRKSMYDTGFVNESAWLDEVLSWPASWSALHGILEVKTPIFKFTTAIDATAREIRLNWLAAAYPNEAAPALRFPFLVVGANRVTGSAAFVRGLQEVARMKQGEGSTGSLGAPRPPGLARLESPGI
jgi:hypothetical protein